MTKPTQNRATPRVHRSKYTEFPTEGIEVDVTGDGSMERDLIKTCHHLENDCTDDIEQNHGISPDVIPIKDGISGYSLPHLSFLLHCFLPSRRLPLDEVRARDFDHALSYTKRIAEIGLSDVTEPLCSGSYFEGLQVPLVLVNGTLDLPDIDMMFVMKHLAVGFNPAMFDYIVDDSQTHVGYVRIWSAKVPKHIPKHLVQDEESGRYDMSSEEITTGLQKVLTNVYAKDDEFKYSSVESHGPAVMKDDKREWSEDLFSAVKHDDTAKFCRDTDIVLALPCSEIPPIAMEWVTRERSYSWPGYDLVSFVFSRGCHLVGSSHSLSQRKSIEWRWSFSEAEKLIAHSLNITQRQCYVLLKIILREELSLPSVLCSYHLKTVLFWTCEGTPVSFWTPQNLGICLIFLLDKLLYFLSRGNIPNYFIRENNVLDHVHPDFISTLTNKLIKVRKDPILSILRFARKSKFVFSPETARLEDLFQSSLEAMKDFRTNPVAFDHSYEDTARKLALQHIYEGRLDLAEGTLEDFLNFASNYGKVKQISGFQYLLRLIDEEEQKVGYLDEQITILEELKMKWISDTIYCSRICRQLSEFYEMRASNGDEDDFNKNIRKAESSLCFALRIENSLGANYFSLGRFLCHQKRYEEAREHLLHAIALENKKETHSGNVLFTSAHKSCLDENLRKEIENIKYILCPMIIMAYYYLTMACVYTNECQMMEKLMAEYEFLAHLAVQAKPEFVICLSMLGYSYMYLGKISEAKRAFALAMSIDADYILSLDAMDICADDSD